MPNLGAFRHTLLHHDAIAEEFCSALKLGPTFGELVYCDNLFEETDLQNIGEGSTTLFWDSAGGISFTYAQADPQGGNNAVLIDMGAIGNNEFVYNRNGGAGNTFEAGHEYLFRVFLKSDTGAGGQWTINYYDGSHHRTEVAITTAWKQFEMRFSPNAASPGYVYILDARSGLTTVAKAFAFYPQLYDLG